MMGATNNLDPKQKDTQLNHLDNLSDMSVLYNAVSDFILTLQVKKNQQFSIANANRAFLSAAQMPLDEIQAQAIEDVLTPESYRSLQEMFGRLGHSGEPISYEVFEGEESKNFCVYRVTLTPIFNANDRCEFLIYAYANITDQKINQVSHDLFTSVVEDAYDSIIITTADLSSDGPRIVYANSAFTRLSGYTLEEVLGKTPRILQGTQTDRKILDSLKKRLSAGKRFHGQTVNYRKDGAPYDVEWHIAPIFNAQNEISHYVSIQRDVTKFENAKRQLEQAQTSLEIRVTERTTALSLANQSLKDEILIREQAQHVLAQQTAELNRRLQEMEAIASVNQAITSTFDADTIFQRIVNAAREIIPHVDRAVIHILDEQRMCLEPVAAAGMAERGNPALSFAVGEGIAGQVLLSPEVISIGDVQKDARFLHKGVTTDLNSLLVVPIMRKDTVLGTISLQSNFANAFSPADEGLVKNLSNSAAIALTNSNLYHLQREQRHYAELFAKISNELNQITTLSELLDRIMMHLRPILSCEAAVLLLIQGEEAVIVRQSIAPDLLREHVLLQKAYSLKTSFFENMIFSERPIIVPDSDEADGLGAEIVQEWVQGFAAAPLMVGQQIIGFILIGNSRPHRFGRDLKNHLQSFATYSAIAIYRARLYEFLSESLDKEKETREQLVQADKLAAMGRMVASVAHELNNPLQTIKNCLYLLKDELSPLRSPVSNYLLMSLKEVQRLSDLVEQLKEVYRPRKSKQMTAVQLDKLLKEVRSLVMPHLRQHRVLWQWEQQYILKRPFTYGNPDHLKQVFLNICLNAIEAMATSQSPTLTVGLLSDESQKRIGIRFQDNGEGIPESYRNAIFDPFFTTKNEGMGLGLAISYDIIRQHNGEMVVESAKEEGTTFLIWLPSHEKASTGSLPTQKTVGTP